MPNTNMHIINVSVFSNHLINDSGLNAHIKISTMSCVQKWINTEYLLCILANDKTLNKMLK